METLKIDYGWNLPKDYTGILEYPNGILVYYVNGLRHREDGPAIIYSDGTLEYYLKGKNHREDGPAIIRKDGSKCWYINNINITNKVNEWLKGKTNIPPYKKWEDRK